MAKKKRHQQQPVNNGGESSESCDENQAVGTGKHCPHIVKSVDISRVRKALKLSGLIQVCASCKKVKNTDASEENLLGEDELMLCLQCGDQSCGASQRNHALKHYETPRSDKHSLAVNTQSWNVWCYECSSEIEAVNKKLRECVDFAKRQGNYVPSPKAQNVEKVRIVQKETQEDDKSPERGTNATSEGLKVKEQGEQKMLPRVRGLSNLGNTCFFNAVLQCLAQTPYLTTVLEEEKEPGKTIHLPGVEHEDPEQALPPITGDLGKGGSFMETVYCMLRELQTGKAGVLNPKPLLGALRQRNAQFTCGEQHDSHELLRHLLECVRGEDLRRYHRVILHSLGLSEKTDPNQVETDLKFKVKTYGRQASELPLCPDQVFKGYLVSTLVCQDCQHTSRVSESFLDLSLPVSPDKPQPPAMRRKASSDGTFDMHGNSVESPPSKYQLKKERRMAKKGKKNVRMVSQIRATMETSKNECESEHSDADVEDNVEQESKLNEASESGYGSMNGSSPAANASPGVEDVDAETVNNSSSMELASRISELSLMREDSAEEDVETVVTNGDAGVGTSRDSDCAGGSGNSGEIDKELCTDGEVDSQVSNVVVNGVDSNNEEQDDGTNAVINSEEETRINAAECDNTNVVIEKSDTGEVCDNVNGVGNSSLVNDVVHCEGEANRKWNMKAFSPRYQCEPGEYSVLSCLNQFAAIELLAGNNRVGCENCTKLQNSSLGPEEKKKLVYTNSTKQLLLSCPPAILTLHLKRFEVMGSRFRKVSRHVTFPFLLDLAPICAAMTQEESTEGVKILYSLYGVVEHSGNLYGGHYVAYVKVREPLTKDSPRWQFLLSEDKKAKLNFCVDGAAQVEVPSGKWYYVSDSQVSEVSEDRVLRSQAYLLFYERIL